MTCIVHGIVSAIAKNNSTNSTHKSNSKRRLVIGAPSQVEAPDGVIKVNPLVDAFIARLPGGPGLRFAQLILDGFGQLQLEIKSAFSELSYRSSTFTRKS